MDGAVCIHKRPVPRTGDFRTAPDLKDEDCVITVLRRQGVVYPGRDPVECCTVGGSVTLWVVLTSVPLRTLA